MHLAASPVALILLHALGRRRGQYAPTVLQALLEPPSVLPAIRPVQLASDTRQEECIVGLIIKNNFCINYLPEDILILS